MMSPNEIERQARAMRADEVNRLWNELRAAFATKVAAILEVWAAFRRTPGLRA